MKRTPSLWHIILVLLLIVTPTQGVEGQMRVWDERLMPPGRTRRHSNPRRNRERWARRLARGRRRRERVLQILDVPPRPCCEGKRAKHTSHSLVGQEAKAETTAEDDPLAGLRQSRGWIDHIDERKLWAMLIQVRWPDGPECPHCEERDPQYLKRIDSDYRGGLGRWQCQVCAEAGDPGEGGTFTPLTGTILEGCRTDVHTLWLMVEMFADGKAGVEAAKEARVNQHTTARLFRLLRAAIYQSRSLEPIVLAPEDVGECESLPHSRLERTCRWPETGARTPQAWTQTTWPWYLGQ